MRRIDVARRLRDGVGFFAHSRFARGTIALQFGGGAQRVLAFLTHIILARGLGAETYGEYVLVVSLAGVLPFVFDVGIRRAVLTLFAAHHAEGAERQKASLLASSLKLSLMSTGLALILGAALLPILGGVLFDSRQMGFLAWILLWGKLTEVPFRLLTMVLEATRNMLSVLRMELSIEGGRLAAVVLAMALGGSLGGLVVALLCLDILLGVVGVGMIAERWYRRDTTLPSPAALAAAWSSASVGALFRFGFLASSAKRLDQGVRMVLFLLLGSLGSPTAAGLFRVAVAIGTLPAWLLAAVARNLLPTLAGHAAAQRWLTLRRTLRRATAVAAGSAIAMAAVLAVLAPWILRVVYDGGQYDGALAALQLMLLYTIVMGCVVGNEAVFLATDDLAFFTTRTLVVGGAVVALAPWVIADHGATGAAALTLGGAFTAMAVDAVRIWIRWNPPLSGPGEYGEPDEDIGGSHRQHQSTPPASD